MSNIESHRTIVIGGGQAGLATSYYLTRLQHEHVILEKDRVAASWRNRWDSFNLLTPNWTLELPGWPYRGDDPDGFLTRDEIVTFLEQYAQSFQAPIRSGVHVTRLTPTPAGDSSIDGYRLETALGLFQARNVVVTTGTYPTPHIPDTAQQFPKAIHHLHTSQYRNPQGLPEGAVLVVGSGVSGCQIARELHHSGRQVYLCVGRAGRLPRRYRDQDIIKWFYDLGRLHETLDPSMTTAEKLRVTLGQFAGGSRTLNLHQFARDGIHLLGRLEAVTGNRLTLALDLHHNLKEIDAGVETVKQGIDAHIAKHQLDAPPPDPADDPMLTDGFDVEEVRELDLSDAGISTVLWATGYRYDYHWIDLPIGDAYGYPKQWRGVTDYPGLYFVGLRWLYQQKSSFVYGVGDDADYVVAHLDAHKASS